MKSTEKTRTTTITKCSICKVTDVKTHYPNLVCHKCDEKAVNLDQSKAKHANKDPEVIEYSKRRSEEEGRQVIISLDGGDNPVYIDGIKCWRPYRFGGWVTMRDNHDCNTIEEFYDKHMRKR